MASAREASEERNMLAKIMRLPSTCSGLAFRTFQGGALRLERISGFRVSGFRRFRVKGGGGGGRSPGMSTEDLGTCYHCRPLLLVHVSPKPYTEPDCRASAPVRKPPLNISRHPKAAGNGASGVGAQVGMFPLIRTVLTRD